MADLFLHEREFELRFLKSRGAAFQDLFCDVMERVFPAQFQRVRPHGNAGDLKCDGYLLTDSTVFQVYGPDEVRRIGRLLAKIDEDFRGAMIHWGHRMARWVFVHNSEKGLPAQAVQVMQQLAELQGAPAIETWGFAEIVGFVRRLPEPDLVSLFPVPARPSHRDALSLPSARAAYAYWTWLSDREREHLATSASRRLIPRTLPIRLMRPEDAAQMRMAEEQFERQHQQDDWTVNAAYGRFVHKPAEYFSAKTVHRLLRKHPVLLVLGDSGTGKSTLLHRVAVAEAERLRRRGIRKRSRRTPVIVDLWRFGSSRTLRELIYASVAESNAAITDDQITAAMTRGYVLLLLDGADEVPADLQRECFAQIINLSQLYPRCRFIVTSRPMTSLPAALRAVAIAPLEDQDVAEAIATRFRRIHHEGSVWLTPQDYVRVGLRPAVRQLCRRPLTLALVVSAMDTDGKLPETLFKVYERFVTWLFGWECQKDPAFSPLAATETLEEAAFALTVTERRALPAAEWSRAVGRAVERIRAGAAANFEPDRLLRVLVSTGLVESFGGEITFSHKSMQEYFTASALIAKQALDHSVALEPGVTRFLCGAVHEIEPILERCLEACTDAASLMPLLQESSRAGADGGRFPELYEAIALGQELGIEITHGMYGPEAEQLIARVQDLVETCVTFGPKTISVLKAAADGVVRGTPWAESRSWFEHIVQGLERLGWPGSPHHRELLELGFFNAERWVTDDQDDLDDEKEFDDEVCDEDLFAYLQAAHEDNFAGAAEHLMAIRRVLGRVPETPVEGQGSLFDELE